MSRMEPGEPYHRIDLEEALNKVIKKYECLINNFEKNAPMGLKFGKKL